MFSKTFRLKNALNKLAIYFYTLLSLHYKILASLSSNQVVDHQPFTHISMQKSSLIVITLIEFPSFLSFLFRRKGINLRANIQRQIFQSRYDTNSICLAYLQIGYVLWSFQWVNGFSRHKICDFPSIFQYFYRK